MRGSPNASRAVTIIIPAFNESVLLDHTVSEVLKAVDVLTDYELILVNDGSGDDTGLRMERLRNEYPHLVVVHHPRNYGLGASYATGVFLATKPFVVMFPGDNCFRSDSIESIFRCIGNSDILIPYHLNADSARGPARRLLSSWYTRFANILSGADVPYYNGTVVHKTEMVQQFGIRTNGFAYQLDLLVRLLASGARYDTVGINLTERAKGKTKAFRIKNVMQVAFVFLRLIVRRLIAWIAPT